ncbi:MAG: hypothetical protein EXR52_01115 [Dehalococcoidia bacterium]|nr:hypothetical protein [Dehalococcoidia bacterium]
MFLIDPTTGDATTGTEGPNLRLGREYFGYRDGDYQGYVPLRLGSRYLMYPAFKFSLTRGRIAHFEPGEVQAEVELGRP